MMGRRKDRAEGGRDVGLRDTEEVEGRVRRMASTGLGLEAGLGRAASGLGVRVSVRV